MNIFQNTVHFLLSGFLIFLVFVSLLGNQIIPSTFAEEQKTTNIEIREPFPGQPQSIDVSAEAGSINILADYISYVFRFVAALSVIIAVLVLMGAGFKIMLNGGDTNARDEAKEWIGKVFMGLAFLFLAGLFLKTVNPNFYIL